jgi:hypothetical protein
MGAPCGPEIGAVVWVSFAGVVFAIAAAWAFHGLLRRPSRSTVLIDFRGSSKEIN